MLLIAVCTAFLHRAAGHIAASISTCEHDVLVCPAFCGLRASALLVNMRQHTLRDL